MHVYAAQGGGVASIITSGSKVTLDALFSILELTTGFTKKQYAELGVADLIKVLDAWLTVNRLEEIAPIFFAMKEKMTRIKNSLPQKEPKPKET